MNKIVISDELVFKKDDLHKFVDCSREFTLRDILNCVKRCDVPKDYLTGIFKTSHWEQYIEEMDKGVAKDDGEVKYLELRRCGEIGGEKEEVGWVFHGIGSVVDENAEDCVLHGIGGAVGESAKAITCIDEKRQEKFAMDFTPVYEMADLKVVVNFDEEVWDKNLNKMVTRSSSRKDISLIEMLYEIFYELSWNGSVENRNSRMEMLLERVKEIKEPKK